MQLLYYYSTQTYQNEQQIIENIQQQNLSNYSIGFIAKRFNDGGVERVTQLLAQQLSKKGMQLLLITDKPQENDYPLPNNVFRIILPFEDEDPISKTRNWDQIQQVIAHQNVQIVNLHRNFKVQLFICQEHWILRNSLTIQTLKRNNIPVIAIDHNFFLYPLCKEENRLFDFAKVAYPMVDALIC
ncbi:Glycosyl_transferases group [Hexamita inflata]|uniref:Glycosyl transferases group n=1 Tax=Hexamita inflata TaxID=28002 RepID=A0AA86TIZ3_9EUKA|nr:Glycosyl transferases group [Hexamita inflata]